MIFYKKVYYNLRITLIYFLLLKYKILLCWFLKIKYLFWEISKPRYDYFFSSFLVGWSEAMHDSIVSHACRWQFICINQPCMGPLLGTTLLGAKALRTIPMQEGSSRSRPICPWLNLNSWRLAYCHGPGEI